MWQETDHIYIYIYTYMYVFKELLKLFREPFYPVYICDSTDTTQQHYLSLTTIIHLPCNAYIISENERFFF